jgi:hypothetical protein
MGKKLQLILSSVKKLKKIGPGGEGGGVFFKGLFIFHQKICYISNTHAFSFKNITLYSFLGGGGRETPFTDTLE